MGLELSPNVPSLPHPTHTAPPTPTPTSALRGSGSASQTGHGHYLTGSLRCTHSPISLTALFPAPQTLLYDSFCSS